MHAKLLLEKLVVHKRTFDRFNERNKPQFSLAIFDTNQNWSLEGSDKSLINAKWYLASLSKAITADLLHKVIDDHKVSASDPINDLLPELDAKCSLDDLMCMSLGYKGLGATQFGLNSTINKAERLRRFQYSPCEHSKAGKSEYHNGYFIAARIALERMTGFAFEQLLDIYVREPSGLKGLATINEITIADFRSPLLFDGQEFVTVPFLINDNSIGAGGLVCTHSDYIKWLTTARYTNPLSTKPLLTSDGFLNAQAYGYGWFFGNLNGQKVRFHSGSGPGYGNFTLHLEEDNITISVLADYHVDFAKLITLESLTLLGYDTHKDVASLHQNLKRYLKLDLTTDIVATKSNHAVGTYFNDECGELQLTLVNGRLRVEFLDCSLSNGYLKRMYNNLYRVIFDNPACRLDPLEAIEIKLAGDIIDMDFYGRFQRINKDSEIKS